MSVSEFQRHQLFQWFEEAMGPERAATMMEVLPHVNWTDIVTKDDLRAEMSAVHSEFATVRGEMSAMEARITGQVNHQTRTLFFATLASNATLVGLVLAAARLA